MVALSKGQVAIVAQALDMRFYPHLGIVGGALCTTVEVNVVFNFQFTDVFFKPSELIIDGNLAFLHALLVLVSFLSFAGPASKFVISNRQGFFLLGSGT